MEDGLVEAIQGLHRLCIVEKGTERPVDIKFDAHAQSLVLVEAVKDIEYTVPLVDVLYAKVVAGSEEAMEFASMSFPNCKRQRRKKGCLCLTSKPKRGRRRVYNFVIRGEGIVSLCEALNTACFGSARPTPVKALVVVNPVAGKSRAQDDYNHHVLPLLRASGKFEVETVFTTHKGHAEVIGADFVSSFFPPRGNGGDSKVYLIVLGGDGIVYELLNGIKKAAGEEYAAVLGRTVVAPIPSGSGNGLCYSALCAAGEPFALTSALWLLLRQNHSPKDLGLIRFENSEFESRPDERLFALTISWGLVADVDINSEFLRPLGDARFTAYGVVRVLKKPLYSGSITDAEGRVEIEPDYVTVYASLVPVASRTVILNPNKSVNDGVFEIYRLRGRDVTRAALISALDELAINRNHEPHIPGFEPIRTSAFELAPALHESRKDSAGIVVDGEPLTRNAVSVRLLPAATHLFSACHSPR